MTTQITRFDTRALEKEWKATLPRYSNHDWLRFHPELRVLIRPKIEELEAQQHDLVELIVHTLRVSSHLPEWSVPRLVIELTLRVTLLADLDVVERSLHQFKWLYASTRKSQQNRSNNMLSIDDLERARNSSVVDVIGTDFELRHSGTTYKGLCPFHGEKTPSFTIWPENGRWYCFGCHEGGDVISYVQKSRCLEFLDAVRELIWGTNE